MTKGNGVSFGSDKKCSQTYCSDTNIIKNVNLCLICELHFNKIIIYFFKTSPNLPSPLLPPHTPCQLVNIDRTVRNAQLINVLYVWWHSAPYQQLTFWPLIPFFPQPSKTRETNSPWAGGTTWWPSWEIHYEIFLHYLLSPLVQLKPEPFSPLILFQLQGSTNSSLVNLQFIYKHSLPSLPPNSCPRSPSTAYKSVLWKREIANHKVGGHN